MAEAGLELAILLRRLPHTGAQVYTRCFADLLGFRNMSTKMKHFCFGGGGGSGV
jgi:hypothetical protein